MRHRSGSTGRIGWRNERHGWQIRLVAAYIARQDWHLLGRGMSTDQKIRQHIALCATGALVLHERAAG